MGELILVDERPFGEPAEPEALEQGDPMTDSSAVDPSGAATSIRDTGTGRIGRTDIEHTTRMTVPETLRHGLRAEIV